MNTLKNDLSGNLSYSILNHGVWRAHARHAGGYRMFPVAGGDVIRSTNDSIQQVRQTTTEKLDIKASICGGTDGFLSIARQAGACNYYATG